MLQQEVADAKGRSSEVVYGLKVRLPTLAANQLQSC